MKKFFTCLYFVSLVNLSFAGDYTHVKYFQKDSIEIQAQNDYSDNSFDSNSRFENRVGLEYGKIVNHYTVNFVKMSFMKGYNFNPYFYLGVGTGFKLYFGKSNNHNTIKVAPSIPLFASFKLNFVNQRFTPYLAIDAGYSLNVGYDHSTFFYTPTFGLRFPIGNKNKMNVGVGYEKQMKEKSTYFDPTTFIEFLSINMGISF